MRFRESAARCPLRTSIALLTGYTVGRSDPILRTAFVTGDTDISSIWSCFSRASNGLSSEGIEDNPGCKQDLECSSTVSSAAYFS